MTLCWIRGRLATTFLLETDSYDQFIARRRELIADQLNLFLGAGEDGEFQPPSDPHLRALNERLENIELRLRRLIEANVDESAIPPHVAEKMRPRIEDARSKSPTRVRRSPTLEAVTTTERPFDDRKTDSSGRPKRHRSRRKVIR
jgi:hypothetical protein